MRHIVVTGASSGIGRAVSERFLAEGWAATLIARREDRLKDVAGGRDTALVHPADVTDGDQVDNAFGAAAKHFGRIDVLFNNAGMFGPMGEIHEVPVDEWRRVVDLNLTGMFLCARAAYRQMRTQEPRGGRIVNNGSISAHAPRPGSVAYTATKHAITGLTKTLALDGRPHDIAAGQVDIGNARTELLEEIAAKNPGAPPPMMDVADVADAVLYMAALPLSANVLNLTVMATKMPFVGRG